MHWSPLSLLRTSIGIHGDECYYQRRITRHIHQGEGQGGGGRTGWLSAVRGPHGETVRRTYPMSSKWAKLRPLRAPHAAPVVFQIPLQNVSIPCILHDLDLRYGIGPSPNAHMHFPQTALPDSQRLMVGPLLGHACRTILSIFVHHPCFTADRTIRPGCAPPPGRQLHSSGAEPCGLCPLR